MSDFSLHFFKSGNCAEQAIRKAIELLWDKNLLNNWQKKRERLMNEKTDVTMFMTEFIEYYLESFRDVKPKYPVRFK